MTVHSSHQPTRRSPPVRSVQERQGGPPEPAAVADLAAELGLGPDQALGAGDPQHAQTYLRAHPGMTGELLGHADAVETARRIFGGLLNPQLTQAIDDELAR
jgi:hypothetical protein